MESISYHLETALINTVYPKIVDSKTATLITAISSRQKFVPLCVPKAVPSAKAIKSLFLKQSYAMLKKSQVLTDTT